MPVSHNGLHCKCLRWIAGWIAPSSVLLAPLCYSTCLHTVVTWHFCWGFCVFATGRIVLFCQVCALILPFCGNIAPICAHHGRSLYRFPTLPDIQLATFPTYGHPNKLLGKATLPCNPLYMPFVWRLAVGWWNDASPLLFLPWLFMCFSDMGFTGVYSYSYSIGIGIIPLYIFGNRNLFSHYFRADFGQLYWISIDFLGLYDLSNVIFALA